MYKPYIDGGKFLPAQHKGETDDQVTAAGNGRADTDAENDDDGDDDGGSGGRDFNSHDAVFANNTNHT